MRATRSRPAASSRILRPGPPPPRSAPTCALQLVSLPATVTIHQGEDLGRPGQLVVDIRDRAEIEVTGTAVAIT